MAKVEFDFSFGGFTLKNAPNEEAKHYKVLKVVMLEKFLAKKNESEIKREVISNQYYGKEILTFLSGADKIYNMVKIGDKVKFELLQHTGKPNQMFFRFEFFRKSETNDGIKIACLEYTGNSEMIEGSETSTFQKKNKFDKDPKDNRMDDLCKQEENLRLIRMEQSRQGPKQVEST